MARVLREWVLVGVVAYGGRPVFSPVLAPVLLPELLRAFEGALYIMIAAEEKINA